MYCYNCGKEIAEDDKFCKHCGVILVRPARFNAKAKQTAAPTASTEPAASTAPRQPAEGRTEPAANASASAQTGSKPQEVRTLVSVPGRQGSEAQPPQSSVKYVYVDKKTGKITEDPAAKTRTESVMQWMTIVFIALTVVIVMTAGAMFISGQMVKTVFSGTVDTSAEVLPVSSETQTDVASKSEPSVPQELLAENLQLRLKGTWSTGIPYKSMSIPATLWFDGNGNCSCILKAMFITKSFDGTYRVQDGGKCSITLPGIEEYTAGGNTMTGNLAFVSDDTMTFTTGSNVWNLKRVE